MELKNIWTEGFEIERNGEKIKLTEKEIRAIYGKFKAANGQSSIECYLDALDPDWDDNFEEEVKICEEMINDEKICRDIWNDFLGAVFYDSLSEELDAVEKHIDLKRERSK